MKFLVDAQLPPALARRLSALGDHAEHVSDKQMSAASDRRIWDYALAVGAVIITKDEDFAVIKKTLRNNEPRVIWLRVRNMRRRDLLVWFEATLPAVLSALERGEKLIEVI
jgi:predicted nuclease of predicted toxin-antitoxin system